MLDPDTGIVVISNSQAPDDALLEAYRFMPEAERHSTRYLTDLLRVLGPEYDNGLKPTPRIAGVIVPGDKKATNILGIGLREEWSNQAYAISFPGERGEFRWVSTYNGYVNYESFNPRLLTDGKTIFEPKLHGDLTKPEDLVNEIYEMSDYSDPQYGDLRVTVLAGIRNGTVEEDGSSPRKIDIMLNRRN